MAPKSTSKKPSLGSKDNTTAAPSSGSKTKSKTLNSTPQEYILRPQFRESSDDTRNTSVIFVSNAILESLELKRGSFVKLTKGLQELILLIDVCDDISFDVVLINPVFLTMNGWLLGDKITLSKFNGQLAYAKSINVLVKESDAISVRNSLIDVGIVYPTLSDSKHWFIKNINNSGDPNNKQEELSRDLCNLSLEDSSINQPTSALESNIAPFLVHPSTTDIVCNETVELPKLPLKHSFEDIGALSGQLAHIKRTLALPLNTPALFTSFGIAPPRGLLLHGNSGVGKSMILRALGFEFPECHVVKINPTEIIGRYLGETEERLRALWQEAIKYQPAIILLDEIDTLVPSNTNAGRDEVSDADNRVLTTLLTLLDDTDPLSKVVIVGATTRVTNVNLSLRRPGRFDVEVEVPVPDANGRLEILNKLLNRMTEGKCTLNEEDRLLVSSKTHGYVGSDLVALVREAVMNGIEEFILLNEEPRVDFKHFENAMLEIKPSAMKEIVLEMPKIKWSDIGGQTVLKRKLKEMVQLPLTSSHIFQKLGIKAPKGLLLYGPPGCSKTMTAKALASESGLNFLAIKGPEMFDKYVGESERKIREIFNKARTSAPSIIFIDEIDAIALDRESGESSNVAKQVLNTMLNEIDGVEELKGVVIIGATNRPDSIDPALLRPGRLDRHVYVAPPDELARREIFEKNTNKFNLKDKEALMESLVQWSEGFSGSECVLLCQEAGLNAIMSVDQITENNEVESVERVHFSNALKEISRNITQEMLEYYESFGKKYSAV